MPISVTNPFAVVDEIASKSASVGELFASYYYVGTLSAAGSFPIFVAPFALQVKQVSIMVYQTAIAADDTNYWRFAPRRNRANSAAEIASKTTQLTGGQAIAQRTEWNFDAAVFNAANALIAKGDAVDLAVFPTGTPPSLMGTLCTVRYEPV
jgi:hypothetical protein